MNDQPMCNPQSDMIADRFDKQIAELQGIKERLIRFTNALAGEGPALKPIVTASPPPGKTGVSGFLGALNVKLDNYQGQLDRLREIMADLETYVG